MAVAAQVCYSYPLMTARERFGENIERLLADRQMNQTDLAERIGLTQAAVSLLINQQRNTSFEILDAIAKALAVDVGDLLSPAGDVKNLNGLTRPDTGFHDTDRSTPVGGATRHESASLSSPDAASLHDLRETLTIFAQALGAAVDTLRAGLGHSADTHQPDATVDVDPPESGDVSSGLR